MWTILIIALVQMPGLALSPAINLIETLAFPEKSLAEVQTVIGLTNLAAPVTSIIAMLFINRGLITKKLATVAGLCFLFLTGLFALLFHTAFWHLYIISILLGLATGCYMTNAFGLMFDNFSDDARQVISGYQTSSINVGGILFGILGGLLATSIWYGGYLLFLIGLPIALLALFTVPGYKSPKLKASDDTTEKNRLNPGVYYYALIAFLFMMIYVVSGSNLSTHLSKIGSAATSGLASAIQMGGGVVSGILFGKLSAKLKDMIMVLACGAIFVGFMILSLFPTSLPLCFIGVFIAGMSLSLMLPHCTYRVSTLCNAATSAAATVIATSLAPSLGGFLSPVVYTNLTTALFGENTVARYAFVGGVALVFGVVLFFLTLARKKRDPAA
jgi:MFS family permease